MNGYDHGWYNGDRQPPTGQEWSTEEPFDLSAYLTAEERRWFHADTRRARRLERIQLWAAVAFIVCLAVALGAAAAIGAIQ